MPSVIPPTHVVGIGASAGGLAALEEFFKAMPEDSGMAFVLIQHLSPDFKSLMNDLLARHTNMPIHRVEHGQMLEANNIYLIPPRSTMTMADGRLHLQERSGHHLSLPIDIFFESLASAALGQAIGIVLSGTGSDGSRGIQAIHEAGGLVLVQSIESAQFDGMLRSAMNTGLCDYVATPAEMPALLLQYAQDPENMRGGMQKLDVDWQEGEYAEVFAHLRRGYGLDFSKYKPTTVGRRISRRLGFHNLSKVSEYNDLLSSNTHELDALYRDLLIGVTEFFRDPQAFAFLEQEVLPELFSRTSTEGLRAWVAACATGEEAYSLAILLKEQADKIQYPHKISVFATDVHHRSLDIASRGLYSEDHLANIPPELLDRYFIPEGPGRYRVAPALRKMVIFAPQNVISDPPFTKMDLVSCRNLLIYFQQEAQERTIAAFNFSLRMAGVLFLGISEGVGRFADEFATLHSTFKVFRKTHDVRLNLSLNDPCIKPAMLTPSDPKTVSRRMVSIDRQILHDYDQLLSRFMPAGVLLGENHQVLHYFGDVAPFLKPLSGRTEVSFANMVVEDLHLAVSVALQRAATLKTSFNLSGVAIHRADEVQRVDIIVECLPDERPSDLHYLVVFSPVKTLELQTNRNPVLQVEDLDATQTLQTHIADLEMELQSARENLQATVEELQTSNEELQAANEELLAANEELQSTNEELHSLNEELYTVNAEYEKKNAELTALNDDHANLLASLDIGVVYLDQNLVIRKYNPASANAFKLMPLDIGRPIDHIAYQLSDQASMIAMVHEVLDSGAMFEQEVQTRSGEWLLQRIYPHLSDKGERLGAILTFGNINAVKTAETKLRTLFDLLPVGVTILDAKQQEVESNPAAAHCSACLHAALPEAGPDGPQLVRADGTPMPDHERLPVRVLRDRLPVLDVEAGIIQEDGSLVWTHLSGAPLPDGGMVLVTMDMTERKQMEDTLTREQALLADRSMQLARANTELERSSRLKDEFLSAISHELRTPLGAILGMTESLRSGVYDGLSDKQLKAIQSIESSGSHLLDMINDLLDFSKIQSGKFNIHPESVSVDAVCQASLNLVRAQAASKGIQLDYLPEEGLPQALFDPRRLKQILANLLSNAVKFTPGEGRVSLAFRTDSERRQLRFTVTDTGIGIAPEDRERIFIPFTQVDGRLNRQYDGTGLGLSLVRSLTDLLGGSVTVESELGQGSCFSVVLPLRFSNGQPPAPEYQIPVHRFEDAPAAAPRGRVLLVDDNEANAAVTAEFLRYMAYTVDVAFNGQEGLALAQAQRPDLILMDIQMPVMNGLEAIRRLRRDPHFANTPIIALTALATSDDRQRCLEAGASDYLSKPFRQEKLHAMVEALLTPASAPEESGEPLTTVIRKAKDRRPPNTAGSSLLLDQPLTDPA
jgi:two-component system, chemotaxis family, CheB/CheR fusion protein